MTFRELLAAVREKMPPNTYKSLKVECDEHHDGELIITWVLYCGDTGNYTEAPTPEALLVAAFPPDAVLDVIDVDQLTPAVPIEPPPPLPVVVTDPEPEMPL